MEIWPFPYDLPTPRIFAPFDDDRESLILEVSSEFPDFSLRQLARYVGMLSQYTPYDGLIGRGCFLIVPMRTDIREHNSVTDHRLIRATSEDDRLR